MGEGEGAQNESEHALQPHTLSWQSHDIRPSLDCARGRREERAHDPKASEHNSEPGYSITSELS